MTVCSSVPEGFQVKGEYNRGKQLANGIGWLFVVAAIVAVLVAVLVYTSAGDLREDCDRGSLSACVDETDQDALVVLLGIVAAGCAPVAIAGWAVGWAMRPWRAALKPTGDLPSSTPVDP